jgi:GNAT superfamily N-acetyltransferase
MSAALHLASAEDLSKILPMMASCEAAAGLARGDAEREAALAPLLDGSPHGAAWLIGPRRSPVGYMTLSFGWSIAAGGLEGRVDQVYIRPSVRGRGMGSEALGALLGELRSSGLKALHLDIPPGHTRAEGIYRRMGFRAATQGQRMTWSGGPG